MKYAAYNNSIKHCKIFLVLLFILACLNQYSFAADLDDLYKPLLKNNRFLYEAKAGYFKKNENGGYIGNYDSFDAEPHYCSFSNSIAFSPKPGWNLMLEFGEDFAPAYKQESYNASNTLSSIQEFDLDYMQDYNLYLRKRTDSKEVYVNILKKIQKSHWDWLTPPQPKFYFTDINTDYQKFQVGFRHITDSQPARDATGLSEVIRPILDSGQLSIEGEVEYSKGQAKRNSDYRSFNIFYNFYHRLEDKFTPSINVRYGLADTWEVESGIFYALPFKYRYEDRTFYADGTSLFRIGEYKLSNNFFMPLSSRYRVKENCEIMVSCDMRYAEQRLDRWQKQTDNSISTDPARQLRYFNMKPELKVTYLLDRDKQIKNDEFTCLTSPLLYQNQVLFEFLYQQDITRLRRGPNSGSQNIIDPENIFLYPVDYFVTNTEYAAFITGDSSNIAANISPQNCHLVKMSFRYGLTKAFDVGMGFGRRSSSRVDHTTLHSLKARSYKFKPYYFFDWFFDWRLSEDSMFSFWSHFVPEYETAVDVEGYTRELSSKSRYFECVAAWKHLF